MTGERSRRRELGKPVMETSFAFVFSCLMFPPTLLLVQFSSSLERKRQRSRTFLAETPSGKLFGIVVAVS